MSDHDEGEVEVKMPEFQYGTMHWLINGLLFGLAIYFLVWGPIVAAGGWIVALVLWLVQGAMSKELMRLAIMGRLLKAALLELAKDLPATDEPTEKVSVN